MIKAFKEDIFFLEKNPQHTSPNVELVLSLSYDIFLFLTNLKIIWS